MTERESNSEPIVLGQQLADARAAEKRRLSKGNANQSPLLNLQYNTSSCGDGLLNPKPVGLDNQLRVLCQEFAEKAAAERESIRQSISMDEFYMLLSFSKRCSVFARREKDNAIAVDGLRAICMIDVQRIDFRDGLINLGLLHHAISANGSDANSVFQAVADLAEPEMAEMIVAFTKRRYEDQQLEAWGYGEYESKDGIGFVGRDYEPYAPDYDLIQIAIQIRQFFEQDKYTAGRVEYATTLPPVWLSSDDDVALDTAINSITGGATIGAGLRPEEHPSHEYQQFTAFLVEVSDEQQGATLLELSRSSRRTRHSMIGVLAGRLFCLLVARSFVQGTDSFETDESIQRFESGLQAILNSYV